MAHVRLVLVLVSCALALAAPARAQSDSQPPQATSRAAEEAERQQQKAREVHPYTPGFFERYVLNLEKTGGFLGAIRPFSAVFGGIKPASGLALGPASGYIFDDGSWVQAKAELSIRRYKLLQMMYQARPLAGGRLIVNGRARWQDAPEVPVFPLGPNSPMASAEYVERKTELSGQALAQPVSFVRLAGGIGVERYRATSGDPDLLEDESLGREPALPGLGTRPTFLHSYALGALDWRDGPGYSRSGTRVEGVLHDFRDRDGGGYSFRRFDGIAEQFIPILHGNNVFELSARLWTTKADSGSTVPFFLMPNLGGSRMLRGFRTFRFRDNDAMVLTGTYRWYIQEYLDGEIFCETGKVASRVGDLDLTNLQKSYGIGLVVHTPLTTVLKVEVARGREGTRLIIGFMPPPLQEIR